MRALIALPAETMELARQHERAITSLSRAVGRAPVWAIPELAGGVRTLEALAELTAYVPPSPGRSAEA
jgi:hypothetical protein